MSVPRSSAALLAVALFLALSPRAEAVLYWSDNNGIERANFDGSFRSDVPDFSRFLVGPFIPTRGELCGLAVDGTSIYWANRSEGTIGRAGLDGSSPNYSLVTGVSEPCGVAVDSDHVYWASSGGHTIGRANLDGSSVDQGFIEAGSRPCGVAVDGAHVYWGEGTESALGRADLDGSDVVPSFIPTAARDCGIAIDDSHIFWTDFLGFLGRASRDGSDVKPEFIGGLDRPCGIALDGGQVYWTAESIGPGEIGRASVDGTGVSRDILPGVGRACSIAAAPAAFMPPNPPPSALSLGRLRRNLRSGAIFLAVSLGDAGFTKVTPSPGVSWKFIPDGYGPALGGGRRWLRLQPASGRAGEGVRRRLRRTGRARIRLELQFQEAMKAETIKVKSLTMLRKPVVGPRRR